MSCLDGFNVTLDWNDIVSKSISLQTRCKKIMHFKLKILLFNIQNASNADKLVNWNTANQFISK